MIWLKIRGAYNYFIDNNEVYALSKNFVNDGEHELKSELSRYCNNRETDSNDVGLVDVKLEKKIGIKWKETEKELESYVAKSGFETVQEWLSNFFKLAENNNLKEGKIVYIYHVTAKKIDFP